MKTSFTILVILFSTSIFAQKKEKSTLSFYANTGFNYGSISDFNNTSDIKLNNRASLNFSAGARLYFKRNKNYCIELGAGLNSVDPIFFISKSNFSPSNIEATDFYSFLPPIYEFFRVNMNFLRKIKIVEIKKTKASLVMGVGIQYLPPFYSNLDWLSNDINGTEYISHRIFFDQINKNNSYVPTNRKLIYNAYLGINVTPTILAKKWLHFEFFWNPSFNSGIESAFILTIPNKEIEGHQNFTFSNYGLKLLFTIPKINLKP